jgi:hypothetical protein
VAQPCPAPTGEHHRHPAALDRQHAVADGVDAAVDRMKPAAAYPADNRSRAEAGVEELGAGNDAVLALRQRRDLPPSREFAPTVGLNSRFKGHPQIVVASDARGARGVWRDRGGFS